MASLLQLFKKEETAPQQSKSIEAEFEKLKAKPIERAEEWTVVNTRLIVGCGCGGGGTDIHIAVPGDHPGLRRDVNSSMDSDDLQEIRRSYPDAIIARGFAPSGLTDRYHPGNFIPVDL